MGGQLLVERPGPHLLVRDMGIQSSKVFVIQLIFHVAIWESDKSSPLTGSTLGVTKKLFDSVCDIRHPHEMIFVEPTHVFFDEMTGNHNDHLGFELRSLPGVSKVTTSVVTLFPLASEICTKLFRHVLGENVQRVDGCIPEVKHSQFFFLFGSSINLYPMTRLLLLLMTRGIVLICIRCCRVALASVKLFGNESGAEIGTRYTIHKGIPFILPWSTDLGVILGSDGLGSSGPWHDRNSGHGSLMQVDLGAKRLQDYWGVNHCTCIELGNRASLGHDVPIPKISCKIGKTVEDLLEETITVPMKRRHRANIFQPMYPVWIVDYGNKVEKNLVKDWLRLIIRTDSGNDRVHVDAKT